MNYFIDTEFIEAFHKPLFGKRRHFIDLISIGIVCEDGREYHAISKEWNWKDADPWVQENVITPLYKQTVSVGTRNFSEPNNFQKIYGKTNKQIAEDICQFIDARYVDSKDHNKGFFYPGGTSIKEVKTQDIEFYAYCADYDWVVFCSLFGRMIDLPKGFPMYCRDLKQMIDEYNERIWYPDSKKYMQGSGVNVTKELALEKLKGLDEYHKQENEHSALDDARWNKKLYNFISNLKPAV